jgi:hypothetical protein
LTDTGKPDGIAWGAEDLAIKFRRKEKEITRALEVLCSPKVGWLVKHEMKNGELVLLAAQQEKESQAKSERRAMVRPTLEELVGEMTAKGLAEDLASLEAEKFVAWFDSVGWLVGRAKVPMKSWRGAVATWLSKLRSNGGAAPVRTKAVIEEEIERLRVDWADVMDANGMPKGEDGKRRGELNEWGKTKAKEIEARVAALKKEKEALNGGH